MDTKRLTKLLNLTFSDKDGEALNAMRAANRMLLADNIHYDSLIRTQIEEPIKSRNKPRESKHSKVEDMLDELLGSITGNTRDFIESLYGHFHSHGGLSEKQSEVLTRIYDKYFGIKKPERGEINL